MVLADDHALTRVRLKELLEAQPGLDLVAECADGREALLQVSRHQPDLLVSDLSMPGLNGLELARETRAASPDTRIILVTIHAEEPYLVEAIESGVRGYVLKQTSRDCLGQAVRAVLAGERYVSPTMQNPLWD